MSTEDNSKEIADSKEALQKDAQGFWVSLKTFIISILDFRGDTDRENTVEAIQKDIPFKGATAWILICSIFVASVGLNANSTAVVIGAMLISPLMGPILGIGLSIAINDLDTLKKSLINFGVMVFLSVATAFLFFWLFPLRQESSELLARTQPDIRDVLIAFFGGLALIIAKTKKGTIASVIFGVAIATALMPPLCTVGYGLAEALVTGTRGWGFAWRAMYLFLINSTFIALATFIVLKLLRFPMKKYANSKRRRYIARLASFLAVLVMIPAGITFYDVLKESSFRNAAEQYISKELNALPNPGYIKKYAVFEYNSGEEPVIELTSFGADQIPESTVAVLRGRLQEYRPLKNTRLLVNQSGTDTSYEDEIRYISELRSRDSVDLLTKDQKIMFLENKVSQLSRLEKDLVPFQTICEEARINYENIEKMSYAKTLVSDFEKIDTLTVFKCIWKDSIDPQIVQRDKERLYKWLKFKLKLDTLVLE